MIRLTDRVIREMAARAEAVSAVLFRNPIAPEAPSHPYWPISAPLLESSDFIRPRPADLDQHDGYLGRG